MANHFVFIIMDSCRYDSYAAANTPNMDRLGKAEKRYSYASWTSPSHYVLFMGLAPHDSPQGVFAPNVYKKEFAQWVKRLDVPGLEFKTFLPSIWLPKVLRDNGYRTVARVSMPVLNPFTPINKDIDDYKLLQNHNDFAGMVAELEFPDDQPCFYFLNLGETHYPYMLEDMPIVSGVHGVLKRMDDNLGASTQEKFFDADKMQMLHQQQIRCVEYVDKILGDLFEKAPANTGFIVTADHGECFGENGYFGHGPIMHEKVFEVPFLEGPHPSRR